MELVVEGRAFLDRGLTPCCIGIEKGVIRAVRRTMRGDEHHDYGNMIILPGAVDPHVHFRDPGLTHKEDFQTGSLAAAFGGVTCVLDMPNTLPPITTKGRLKEKKEAIAGRSWVDYGLFAAATPHTEFSELVEEVIGFKLYMASATGDLLVDERDLPSALAKALATGKVLSVHAEDGSRFRGIEEADIIDHHWNRPPESEVAAITRLASLTSSPRVNICHVSSAQAMGALAHLPFLTEATPHHMLLTTGRGIDAFRKVNPPIRTRGDRDAIFEAFSKGEVEMLASDHAPHTKAEKEDDFGSAPPGVPGVETAVPLLLPMVKSGALGLSGMVSAMAERASGIFGLNKGRIQVGKDADLMVVDTSKVTRVRGERLHSKCGWTIFEGMEAIFPHATFVRGERVIEDGAIVGERVGRDVVRG